MIKGDTTQLILNYNYDGVPIEDETFTDIVMQFNKEGSERAMKFKLNDTTYPITKDTTLNKYVINLTQAQSLQLGLTIKYQLTVEKDGKVFSSVISSMTRNDLLRTSEV